MAFEQGLVISELDDWAAKLTVRDRLSMPMAPPSQRNTRGLRTALDQLTAEARDRFMAAIAV